MEISEFPLAQRFAFALSLYAIRHWQSNSIVSCSCWLN